MLTRPGIFAGASMSGDLKSPSTSIPIGTLWAILTTFSAYLLVILSLAASTSHGSLLRDKDVIQDISLYAPTILAGEVAVTFFSALMGVIGASKLMQALARDKLFPGFSVFGKGLKKSDEPVAAIFLTYFIAQLALFADLDQLASLISIFYMVCEHKVANQLLFLFCLAGTQVGKLDIYPDPARIQWISRIQGVINTGIVSPRVVI